MSTRDLSLDRKVAGFDYDTFTFWYAALKVCESAYQREKKDDDSPWNELDDWCSVVHFPSYTNMIVTERFILLFTTSQFLFRSTNLNTRMDKWGPLKFFARQRHALPPQSH